MLFRSDAAFVLMGFYVTTAFERYTHAGNVWGDNLRAACHSLAAQWYTMSDPGTWHDGDHDRVLAHIAAIPIALKMELRHERDVRELKGLLSEKDLGRIQAADSMSSHCVDVIRAYYHSGLSRPEHLPDPSKLVTENRKSFVKNEILHFEDAIRQCKLLKTFPIAPGFLILLRTLLGIWFILVPFVLAEENGTQAASRTPFKRWREAYSYHLSF